VEKGFWVEKKADKTKKKLQKYFWTEENLEIDEDLLEDLNDLIEEIETLYEKAKPKAKVKQMTEAEKKNLLEKKKAEFTLTLTSKSKMKIPASHNKKLSVILENPNLTKEHIEFLYKGLIDKAVDKFLDDYNNISIKQTKSMGVRPDGSIGAVHKQVIHPEKDYRLDAEGKPITIKCEIGAKVKTFVDIKRNASNHTEKFSIAPYDNPNKYLCVESLCKDTNADGYKQAYLKTLTFDKNPEWMGEGFCKCAVDNKKFLTHLRVKNESTGVWEKVDKDFQLPKFCCNAKLSSGSNFCKRHSKNASNPEWKGLGSDDFSVVEF